MFTPSPLSAVGVMTARHPADWLLLAHFAPSKGSTRETTKGNPRWPRWPPAARRCWHSAPPHPAPPRQPAAQAPGITQSQGRCRSRSSPPITRCTTPAPTSPRLSQQSGAKYLTLAFLQTAAPARAPPTGTATPASRSPRRSFGSRHRRDPGARRQRDPVVRRLRRRHHRHRDRRQLHQRRRDRQGVRERHHHLQRAPHRPGHRGRLAQQHGRDQPPQQGDRADRGVGRGAPAGRSSSPTPCRPTRPAWPPQDSAVLQNAVANGATDRHRQHA